MNREHTEMLEAELDSMGDQEAETKPKLNRQDTEILDEEWLDSTDGIPSAKREATPPVVVSF